MFCIYNYRGKKNLLKMFMKDKNEISIYHYRGVKTT